MRLCDIGERKLTEEYLPTICPTAGDDCGYVENGESDIVITTDPVPLPAAEVIAGDPDPYWVGRLLVTINASDLAAAGASPIAFVAALEMDPGAEFARLEALVQGINDACAHEGLKYVGGNLKESKTLGATGTAIGRVPKAKGLHRKGARAGDLIYCIGQGGEFWRDVFRWRSGERFDKITSKLFSPYSQLKAMQILREGTDIKCSMDNSDGLLSTLEQLSRVNGLSIHVDTKQLVVEEVADPLMAIRYWLGWGDWTVIIGVAPEDRRHFEDTAQKNDVVAIRIGSFVAGQRIVLFESTHDLQVAPRLESERFAKDSWFIEGIEGYIARLTSLRLR